jgi:hypothetical protein
MKNVAVEIRDRGTFIPAFFTVMVAENGEQSYLLHRCGWNGGVVLTRMDSGKGASDPYDWTGLRTMTVAHDWLNANYESVKDGDVVDVEFILGETTEKKVSERLLDVLNIKVNE